MHGFFHYFWLCSWTLTLVMARYSYKGHDTIRYAIHIYDTIWKYFTVRKNRKQAGDSAQHWSTVVLPINTVAAAGAWLLAVRRGDSCGRPARWLSAGGRCPWSPGLFSRATVSTGRQTIAAVETLHSCYCLGAAWPAGGRTAQIFSDCAITKYLSRATAFTVNTLTHLGGQAITAN